MTTGRPRVNIGGTDYELILTTAATKEINERFGGLTKLGSAMSGTQGIETACWLIALLANQGIRRQNLFSSEKLPELTEEAVELLTTPGEIAEMAHVAVEAIKFDSQRHVESEPEGGGKN